MDSVRLNQVFNPFDFSISNGGVFSIYHSRITLITPHQSSFNKMNVRLAQVIRTTNNLFVTHCHLLVRHDSFTVEEARITYLEKRQKKKQLLTKCEIEIYNEPDPSYVCSN